VVVEAVSVLEIVDENSKRKVVHLHCAPVMYENSKRKVVHLHCAPVMYDRKRVRMEIWTLDVLVSYSLQVQHSFD
jgi:hypothetical protein